MYKCEYDDKKDCPFPHKCQNMGCSLDSKKPYAERRLRKAKLAWQQLSVKDEAQQDG